MKAAQYDKKSTDLECENIQIIASTISQVK